MRSTNFYSHDIMHHCFYLRVHVLPSALSTKPSSHVHMNEPCVLMQSCWHTLTPSHSLTSVWKLHQLVRLIANTFTFTCSVGAIFKFVTRITAALVATESVFTNLVAQWVVLSTFIKIYKHNDMHNSYNKQVCTLIFTRSQGNAYYECKQIITSTYTSRYTWAFYSISSETSRTGPTHCSYTRSWYVPTFIFIEALNFWTSISIFTASVTIISCKCIKCYRI